MFNAEDVTVLICSYNDNRRLRRAVFSVLRQTRKPSKILIVDDNSKDCVEFSLRRILKFAERCDTSTIKILRNDKNMGIGYSRNKGLQNIDSKIISFLDSDDYWERTKIEKVLDAFNKYTNIDLVAHVTLPKKKQDQELNIDTTNGSTRKTNYSIRRWYRAVFVSLPQTSGISIKNPGVVRFSNMRYSEDLDFFIRYFFASRKDFCLMHETLGFCDRPQLSRGGLSGKRINMRIGQFITYLKLLMVGLQMVGTFIIFLISLPLRLLNEFKS